MSQHVEDPLRYQKLAAEHRAASQVLRDAKPLRARASPSGTASGSRTRLREMPNCPLVPKGVTAKVETAAQELTRARALDGK